MKILDIKNSSLNKNFAKNKNSKTGNKGKVLFLSYKINFKQRAIQGQAFPQHPPRSKITIQKSFKAPKGCCMSEFKYTE